MQVAQFVRKYTISSNGKKSGVKRDRINSTVKWVEYTTDLIKMTDLLKTASFEEKCNLATAMQVAERKKIGTTSKRILTYDVQVILCRVGKTQQSSNPTLDRVIEIC